MKQYYSLLIVLASILLLNCRSGESPNSNTAIPNTEAIKMVQQSDELKNEIKTTSKYHNKEVELLGSFSISGVMLQGDKNNLLKMGFEGIDVWVPVNQEKNSALLPNKEKFLDTEVQIIDDTGKSHQMRTFPVFKATCRVNNDPGSGSTSADDTATSEVDERIIQPGISNEKLLEYKLVVTKIEWIGDRDYYN